MKILITGTSKGIGRSIAIKFLDEGHNVIGIDKLESSIENNNYTHLQYDINADFNKIPKIENVNILVNNAGVQNEGNDIDVNLKATINITESFGIQENIKSIIFIASASARTGCEFPEYVASKGGMVAYMKNVASRIAKYKATSNSISPGGVLTELNAPVINDEKKWNKIMELTPLKKWATSEEIAEWVYFIGVINKSMTSQDILIDNGEYDNGVFVW